MGKRQDISLEEVLDSVSKSKRYRWIADEVVRRLATEEIPKARTLAEAEKRTKRRLHQIFGAYATSLKYERLLAEMTEAKSQSDLTQLKELCRTAMYQHASTKERLPILDIFFKQVFEITGQPAKLLDLACGLNPLAYPWMNLSADCVYMGSDIDKQIVSFVHRFLELMGVSHLVTLEDAVTTPPQQPVDLVFLLKALPCLERQKAGASRQLLEKIPAPQIVVSYPTRSLGGKSRGMAATYRKQFAETIEGFNWRTSEIEFPGELVFIIDKS